MPRGENPDFWQVDIKNRISFYIPEGTLLWIWRKYDKLLLSAVLQEETPKEMGNWIQETSEIILSVLLFLAGQTW